MLVGELRHDYWAVGSWIASPCVWSVGQDVQGKQTVSAVLLPFVFVVRSCKAIGHWMSSDSKRCHEKYASKIPRQHTGHPSWNAIGIVYSPDRKPTASKPCSRCPAIESSIAIGIHGGDGPPHVDKVRGPNHKPGYSPSHLSHAFVSHTIHEKHIFQWRSDHPIRCSPLHFSHDSGSLDENHPYGSQTSTKCRYLQDRNRRSRGRPIRTVCRQNRMYRQDPHNRTHFQVNLRLS